MPRNDTALVNLNLWDIEFPVEFQPISFPHISGFELTFPFGFGVIIEAATARSYLQRWFPLPAPSVAALPLPGASSWLPILQSRFHVWTNALKGPAEAASRLTDGPTDWLFLSLDQSDPTQESSLSSIADLHKKTISKMEALSFTTTNSSLTGKWKYKMKLKSLEKLDAEPLPTLSRKFFVSCKLCLSPSSVTDLFCSGRLLLLLAANSRSGGCFLGSLLRLQHFHYNLLLFDQEGADDPDGEKIEVDECNESE